jgi:hypothetical protein
MKETDFTRAVDEAVETTMKAVDYYIKNEIEPILDSLGSPEKLIGKPYEQWTPQDLQVLSQIYGKTLETFIAKKEINSLIELEQTERMV